MNELRSKGPDTTRARTPHDPPPILRWDSFGADTSGARQALSDREQAQLATIATRVRLPARTLLYREAEAAHHVFVCERGTMKVFRSLPSGKRRIVAFLFPGDLFGLADHGNYVNTAQAVGPVTLFRIRLEQLTAVLRHDAHLEFSILSKIVHELREAQRQTIIVGRRDAPGRLAMFLTMLERHVATETGIRIPMSRADIADYLALTPEAVSRAVRTLRETGIVAFPDAHQARVLDRRRFTRLAGET